MTERKLVTVRRIKELKPIAGADRIEVAVVDGWEVIVKKGEFKVDSLCIYLEIDSWVPTTLAPFLTKEGKEPKEYKGVKGERLRTIKMKGQLSQGLVLPIDYHAQHSITEGRDVTKAFGVLKYEIEEKGYKGPGQANYSCKLFPTNLFPKTDQERIQNCFDKLPTDCTWEKTLKLDGSSCTIFYLNGKLRVCSRNLELKVYEDKTLWQRIKTFFGYTVKEKAPDNNFVKMALQVEEQVKQWPGLAFQGELMGPGIQNNREGFTQLEWYVYDIVDTTTRQYLSPHERRAICAKLRLKHVPVIETNAATPNSVAAALDEAGLCCSINHLVAEGLVCKSNTKPEISFKAISNKYLLKEE